MVVFALLPMGAGALQAIVAIASHVVIETIGALGDTYLCNKTTGIR